MKFLLSNNGHYFSMQYLYVEVNYLLHVHYYAIIFKMKKCFNAEGERSYTFSSITQWPFFKVLLSHH